MHLQTSHCSIEILLSKGCRMEADTPLKVLCIALWRSSSVQPELLLILFATDHSPNLSFNHTYNFESWWKL
jgi:hypothetical protein